jgi:hypothetical protein
MSIKGLNAVFQTSQTLEKKGVWIELGDINEDGKVTKFLIARAGGSNTEFEKAMEKVTKKHLIAYRAKALSPSQMRELTIPLYAKYVVMGWENVMCDDQYIDYTPENCERLFRQFGDFFDFIAKEAGEFDLFRQANLEAVQGN